jgi:hypothetical protein
MNENTKKRTRRTKLNGLASSVVNYLIDRHRMTVTEIARICEVDKSFISRCKNGERELGESHLTRLADSLRVGPGALVMAAMPTPWNPDPELRGLQEKCNKLMHLVDQLLVSVREREAAKGQDRSKPPSAAA